MYIYINKYNGKSLGEITFIYDNSVAKINCGRYSKLCKKLNINHYPTWGVLKPGGAFEVNHGKNSMNDVTNFAKNSLKAQNVWALSPEKVHSILSKQSGGYTVNERE
jgi:DnaJ family protein C protein 10